MSAAHVLLHANLDCEHFFARWAARGTDRKPRPLPPPVLERVSLFGTLLRVFANEGDRLWTPVAVDPACVRAVPGLPDVALVSGRGYGVPANFRVAGWGDAPPPNYADAVFDAATAANDRTFAVRVRREADLPGLPGTAVVESVDALIEAEASAGAWVAKAPHAAAGRERVLGEGRDLTGEASRALARLLREQGRLVLEPWVERVRAFGICGDTRVRGGLPRFHAQEVGARGRFRGIRVPAPSPAAGDGVPAEVEHAFSAVRAALDEVGYRGCFGVDGFTWRDEAGEERIHPLGEINARMTFGLVAHALAERVARPLWGPDAGEVALRFGDEPERRDAGTIPLVGDAAGTTMHAWLLRSATPAAS